MAITIGRRAWPWVAGGAVYRLQRGAAEIPVGVEWRDKPRGEAMGEFLDRSQAGAVWRRQLVLGPAPEFCFATPVRSGREPLGLL